MIKKLLATLAMSLAAVNCCATDVVKIPDQIARIICSSTKGLTFPTPRQVAGIIKVESNFNVKAKNGASNGLMQVNKGSFDPTENVSAGISMLSALRLKLGSDNASFLAYNSGLTGYKQGRYSKKYLAKVLSAQKNVDITC